MSASRPAPPAPAARCAVLLALLFSIPAPADERADLLRWRELPPLPDAEGFGGPFVGVHNGALVVAGGANFPDGKPWEGGAKVYYDRVFVLPDPAAEWLTGFRLPKPMAYGAAISTEEGVLLLGGMDAERVHADVRLLRWDPEARSVSFTDLPPLPQPSALMAAGKAGGVVYVVPGQSSLDETAIPHAFWALDLARGPGGRRWEELPPCPGPPRYKAVAAVQKLGDGSEAFFLFGGDAPRRSPGGAIVRDYRTDAYRYHPRQGWRRVADVPQPIAAGCAAPLGPAHVLTFSGDTGEHVHEPAEQRPGFPKTVFAYHTITDTWVRAGEMPESVVTTGAARWGGRIVIASGEAKPGVRSPKVWAAEPVTERSDFGWANSVAVAAYLAGIVALGVFFTRRTKTTDDFFRGGRRVPWWAAGLSIFATILSSITFMAIPATAYATDWVLLLANLTIPLVAPVVVFVYLPFYRRLEAASAYEYLERRFNYAARAFAGLAFVAFQLGKMAIVLYLPALALATVTDIDLETCVLAVGLLSVVYCVLGGIEAVIWTDVAQAVILLGGALLAFGLILADTGVSGFVTVAAAHGKFHTFNWTADATVAAVWVVVIGQWLNNLVPYTADQSVVQRYMTTPDRKRAARAVWTNAGMAIVASLLFFSLGPALFVFYHLHPARLDPTVPVDAIFPLFIARELPPGVAGLVVAGLFAAVQSTLSSSLNSMSTVLVSDFYQRFRPGASDRFRLGMARVLTLLLGVACVAGALWLGRLGVRGLFENFLKYMGLVGGTAAGLFALGIFTRRASGAGALIGIVASLTALALVVLRTPLHGLLYAAVGIGACVAAGWLASLALPCRKDVRGLTVWTAGGGAPADQGERAP